MIFLIISVIAAIAGVIIECLVSNENKGLGGFIVGCAALLFILGSLVPTGAAYNHNLNDLGKIRQFKADEAIYQQKADALTGQFRTILAVQYPNFEKKIFQDLSPKNVGAYLAAYPQLRTVEALQTLVRQINDLQSQVYQQGININQSKKNLYVRKRDPFLISFLLPS